MRAMQKATSGGFSETEVKELAASPHGRPSTGSTAVIATTPVANLLSTCRNRRLSGWPFAPWWAGPVTMAASLRILR
ncbi:hypothetical protein GCM10027203_11050 [Nonomuraea fastidiosa]